MHVKIRFVDNSPTCASLSQTQMHWEISCEGICIAVDEVAKLKLAWSLNFASAQGSKTKEGWAERGVSMILNGVTFLMCVTLQRRQPSVHLPWWQRNSGRCYFSSLRSKSYIGAKWSELLWERAVPHLLLAFPRGPSACFALVTVVLQPQHESMHRSDPMAGLHCSGREVIFLWISRMNELVP